MTDKYAVVILNWNNAPDTLDCLKSIFKAEKYALPIVVDNGSTDNSLQIIKNSMMSFGKSIISGTFEEIIKIGSEIKSVDLVLVEAKENYGFAKGCNLGLKIVSTASLDITVFLNNDTIVEHGALSKMVNKLKETPNWFATIPLITIYNTNLIWNCGGHISSFGFRRYYHANKIISSVKLKKEIPCTFITGCCFAVRTSDFMKRNGFTERFFFGEEDFELSLWMKDNGLYAVCLTDAVVHHKVGASISYATAKDQSSKIFLYYLNRFIHMRLRFGKIRWTLWLCLYIPYIIGLLVVKKKIILLSKLPRFLKKLLKMAVLKDSVTREDFELIMRETPW